MTKTELVNKWGKVGGRVLFDATEQFTKDLDSYLNDSRLAENLVIASKQRSVLVNGAVADKKEILEEAISIMRSHCLKNDINQIAYPWITIHLMDGSANIHYDIDENDDSDGTETINLDATIKKLLE